MIIEAAAFQNAWAISHSSPASPNSHFTAFLYLAEAASFMRRSSWYSWFVAFTSPLRYKVMSSRAFSQLLVTASDSMIFRYDQFTGCKASEKGMSG